SRQAARGGAGGAAGARARPASVRDALRGFSPRHGRQPRLPRLDRPRGGRALRPESVGRPDRRAPRLFVALRFPDTVNEALEDIAGDLPGAAWIPAERYHLTLRFIGDPAPMSIDDLDHALRGIRAPAFHLGLKGTGHFPLRGDPASLWVGVEEN